MLRTIAIVLVVRFDAAVGIPNPIAAKPFFSTRFGNFVRPTSLCVVWFTPPSASSTTSAIENATTADVTLNLDAAITGGNTVSDLLLDLKAKATAATDTSLTTAQRDAFNADFLQLRDALQRAVDNSEFNGANAIKSGGDNIVAFANDTGSSTITITAQSFALSGSNVTLTTSNDLSSLTNAQTALSKVNASITNVNKALATFGAASRALDKHKTFLASLSDTLEAGIGNLVDADLAKESAKLTSLQVKQQLGAQALSIANSSTSILLSFFR